MLESFLLSLQRDCAHQKKLNFNIKNFKKYVTEIYKEAFRAKEEVFRSFLNNFEEEGLNEESSMQHIKRVIDSLDRKSTRLNSSHRT